MRPTTRPIACALVLCLIAWASAGCVSLGLDRFFGGKLAVHVAVDPTLNELSPVAVELLVVYDKKVLTTLQQMTATQWFEQRTQLLQQYSETSRDLDHWKWEWVPGQVVEPQECRYRIGARGALVFVDYFAPGDHRANVDPFRPLLLDLEADSFTAEPMDHPGS